MTATELAALAGLLLSLAFSYIPGVQKKFEPLAPQTKSVIMLGLVALAAVLVYSAACVNVTIPGVTVAVTCDRAGAMGLVNAFVAALVANQATFLISPKPKV